MGSGPTLQGDEECWLQGGPEPTHPLGHPALGPPISTHGHTRSCRLPPSWSRTSQRGVGPWAPCSHPTIREDACVGSDHAEDSRHPPVGDLSPRCNRERLGDLQEPGSWASPGPQGHTRGTGASHRPSWCAARAGDRVQPFHFTNEQTIADGLNADESQ